MTFDVRHIGSIRYTNTMGADIKLRLDLEQAVEAQHHRRDNADSNAVPKQTVPKPKRRKT